MKKLVLFLMVLVSCIRIYAGDKTFETNSIFVQNDVIPDRSVSYDQSGITVKYQIHSVNVENAKNDSVNLRIKGFGFDLTEGQPSLPMKSERFLLPEWVDSINVKVVTVKYEDANYKLAFSPKVKALYDNTSANENYITSSEIAEESNIIISSRIGTKKHRNFAEIVVKPIQYNCKNNEIRAFYEFEYRIEFFSKDGTYNQTNYGDNNLTKSANGGVGTIGGGLTIATTKPQKEHYIIVSVPKYQEAVQKLAAWKKLQGYTVHYVSGVYSNNVIWQQLRTIYNQYPNVNHVIIIGNNSDVASYKMKSTNEIDSIGYTYLSDKKYSCLDFSMDTDADVHIGRLPVSTLEEANVVVDKIINYERNPTLGQDFYKSSAHCAYYEIDAENDSTENLRFTLDSELLRDYAISKGFNVKRIYYAASISNPKYWSEGFFGCGGTIPQDLQKPNFAWNGNSTDIINAFNKGCNYILFSTHGYETGVVYPTFNIAKVEKLTNGTKLPIVFIMSCHCGNFSDKNLASALLTKKAGGAVAVYANTEKSYCPNESAILHGMFNAIWPSPGFYPAINNSIYPEVPSITPKEEFTLGKIYEKGIDRIQEMFNFSWVQSTTKLCIERLHLFGDPSMLMFTETPTAYNDSDIKVFNSPVNNKTNKLLVRISIKSDNEQTCLAYSSADSCVRIFGKTIQFSDSITVGDRFLLYGPNKIPKEINYLVYNNTPNNANSFSLKQNNKHIQLCKSEIEEDIYETESITELQLLVTNISNGETQEYVWPKTQNSFIIDASSMDDGQYIVSLYDNGKQLKYWNIILK